MGCGVSRNQGYEVPVDTELLPDNVTLGYSVKRAAFMYVNTDYSIPKECDGYKALVCLLKVYGIEIPEEKMFAVALAITSSNMSSPELPEDLIKKIIDN